MPENCDMIDWMRRDNRSARAARNLEHFFDVVFQIATWNSQKKNLKFTNLSFNDKVKKEQ